MNFHIMTLFPEMIEQGLKTSILGRATDAGYIHIEAINIRDFTENKHNKVDDYPYGGGAGMLMQAQPIYDTFKTIEKKIATDKPTRVIYLTPQGKVFNQSKAKELAKEENLIFLCGHYEGIDERVLEEIVTDEISLGDYVLTGGELGAMVLIDAISRLVPGVLNNDESANTESFHNDLLEYPQYSRPPIWHEKQVPAVLLSGNHKDINKWRLETSISRTIKKRPDLYAKYEQSLQAIKLLQNDKLLNMDMIEAIRLGNAQILYFEEDGILIKGLRSNIYFLSVFQNGKSKSILDKLPKEETSKIECLMLHEEEEKLNFLKAYHLNEVMTCYQAVYTRGVTLKVDKNIVIEKLGVEFLTIMKENYHMQLSEEYLLARLQEGAVYGAFIDGNLAGFIGSHEEGEIGLLEVFPEYRRKGIGINLERFMINKYLKEEKVPFGQVIEGNHKSLYLQEKLGLRISKKRLCWLEKLQN